MEAVQQAALDEPVAGLAEQAAARGWQPVQCDTVVLDNPMYCVGHIALCLHGAIDPDKGQRSRCRDLASQESSPVSCPVPLQFAHCFRANTKGRSFVVGNACLAIPRVGSMGTTYKGPMAPPKYAVSAFCRLEPIGRREMLQVTPAIRGKVGRGPKTEYPGLNERFDLNYALQPDAMSLLGPEIVAFLTSREDWAFSLHENVLTSATLDPLRSGEDAEGLLQATLEAASLLGR
jgi:hypothetical protein